MCLLCETAPLHEGRARQLFPRHLAAVLLIAGLGAWPAAAATCVGDCGDDGLVEIADLLTGVDIALGLLPVADCENLADRDGRIDVAQLVQGVNNSLDHCREQPTPTPTTAATSTATPTATSAVTPTSTGERFVDHGDGTITDTQTGSIWEKKDHDGGLHDSRARFPWAGICSDSADYCQPDAAAAAACTTATGGAMGCALCSGTATCQPIIGTMTVWDWLNQLNATNFAGHSDWRIPTVGRDGGAVQLETIVDTSVPGCGSGVACVPAAFDTACVDGCMASTCSCTQAERYWSMTPITSNPNLPFPSVWGVFFFTGEVAGVDEASAFFVRAVRDGS